MKPSSENLPLPSEVSSDNQMNLALANYGVVAGAEAHVRAAEDQRTITAGLADLNQAPSKTAVLPEHDISIDPPQS